MREENRDREDGVMKLKFGDLTTILSFLSSIGSDTLIKRVCFFGLRKTGSPESVDSTRTSAIDSTGLC